MGIARRIDMQGLAGLAILCAMGGGEVVRPEPQPVRYREFCGPPFPKSRQHRRAMMRQAAKAIAA